ncbi:MAG: hypothetical protein UW60_C0034G0001 [Candidatus Woesebacteria bacterium GW2011_GWA2_44_33]|uniref:Uncharacterized protein n=1 Tax=Candidatus Woesebacteria bacterium GW2011_GWA2_44_33 TaxID=1618564 RepID=A0A0G1J3E6_9BACT|nr:MAG: hypothetical protein UW60_C0034G0001 [Candidatus Woesebacteria bacterium GW2011_GWA2_44_33]
MSTSNRFELAFIGPYSMAVGAYDIAHANFVKQSCFRVVILAYQMGNISCLFCSLSVVKIHHVVWVFFATIGTRLILYLVNQGFLDYYILATTLIGKAKLSISMIRVISNTSGFQTVLAMIVCLASSLS